VSSIKSLASYDLIEDTEGTELYVKKAGQVKYE
jgi:hypothetical protein